MSWLINKLTGSAKKPQEPADDESPASSAPTSPSKPTPLFFHPSRPTSIGAASSFTLPQEALGGGSEVARAAVSLYMQAGDGEMSLRFPAALILLVKSAAFTYEFKIVSKEKVLIVQPLVSTLTFYFKPPSHTLVWNMSMNGSVHALVVCFANDAEEENFKSFWNMSYLETSSGRGEKELKDIDQNWAIRASDAMDVDYSAEDEDLDWEKEDGDKLSMDDFPPNSSIRVGGAAASSSSSSSIGASSSPSKAGHQNENLAVGMAVNRTFVNRGSQLGVFKHDDQGLLQYLNQVPIVKDMNGEEFAPSKMMLHDQDGQMMLLNPEKKGSVYQMDLEYGKIVQEFNAGDAIPEIRTLAPTTKYAERTGEATFLGVGKQSVFQLDPRQNGKNKLAENKMYKTTPKFSSIASTNSGYVAVGADDGQIRLYDSISKVAKTALPGLGDAIIGIDVTADGSYVLATTKHYLLLIPTQVDGQDKNGFRQSITSKAGAPIKLQIDPTDMAKYNIQELKFTPARFNTGEGQEAYISASTGPYLITWSMNALKAGKRFGYKIKKCESTVVADQSLYGFADKVVVTLPDNVYLQKMKLKK